MKTMIPALLALTAAMTLPTAAPAQEAAAIERPALKAQEVVLTVEIYEIKVGENAWENFYKQTIVNKTAQNYKWMDGEWQALRGAIPDNTFKDISIRRSFYTATENDEDLLFKEKYTDIVYNKFGRRDQTCVYIFDDWTSTYRLDEQTDYTYNTKGFATQVYEQVWHTEFEEMVAKSLTKTEYTDDGKITKYEKYSADEDGNLHASIYNEFAFDDHGTQIYKLTKEVDWTVDPMAWVDVQRICASVKYNENDKLCEETVVTDNYNRYTKQWENVAKRYNTYIYHGSQQILTRSILYDWANDDWRVTDDYYYEYNERGKQTLFIKKTMDDALGEAIYSDKTETVWDADGNMVSKAEYKWDNSIPAWFGTRFTDYVKFDKYVWYKDHWEKEGTEHPEEENPTAVGPGTAAQPAAKALGRKGRIDICGNAGEVKIIALSGAQIACGKGQTSVAAAAGIYLVNIDGTTTKVVVR